MTGLIGGALAGMFWMPGFSSDSMRVTKSVEHESERAYREREHQRACIEPLHALSKRELRVMDHAYRADPILAVSDRYADIRAARTQKLIGERREATDLRRLRAEAAEIFAQIDLRSFTRAQLTSLISKAQKR